jgi:hypothetical protein
MWGHCSDVGAVIYVAIGAIAALVVSSAWRRRK